MITEDDIVFLGRDGNECEQFIRAIHKAAYVAGKIRDDEWMADLALSCFSGRALRYYESLEPEIQYNWKLLRKALLARYPPEDGDADEIQSTGSSALHVLAPTGPHGPRLNARTGRIKVIGANSADFGYLGDGKTVYSNGTGAGASAAEAITVCYVPGSKLCELEIQRSDEPPQALGVHWNMPSPSTTVGCGYFALVTAFDYEGSYRSNKLMWKGPGYTRIWSVLADNTLCPHLEEHGSRNPLHLFLYNKPEHQRYAVDAAADAGAFVTTHGAGGWVLVKLLFEPIISAPRGSSADNA